VDASNAEYYDVYFFYTPTYIIDAWPPGFSSLLSSSSGSCTTWGKVRGLHSTVVYHIAVLYCMSRVTVCNSTLLL